MVSKLSEILYDPGCSSRILILDPDPEFLPIPDPGSGVKKAPNPGSQHWLYLTVCCAGADAAVLLHAKAADGGHGEPQGAQGVPHMRQDALRPLNVEQTHENTHR